MSLKNLILNSKMVAMFVGFLILVSCVHQPEPSYPIPTVQQLDWQQLETYAFIHFGLNTFNDMEWGYGNSHTYTFNPTSIDCEQWVKTLKNSGMKGVIFTAKHHDGFCLWPTETTDYSIKNTYYKDGQGDLVRELSEACKKHGLKFGIYVSPWDRHQAEYGYQGYVDIYHKQIEELTSNYGELFEFWFDGANGGTGWYGGADEMRSIVAEKYYDYEKARNIVWSHSPHAAIFGGTVPTLRWVGNEKGFADATQWCMYKTDFKSLNDEKCLVRGFKDGEAWLPAEVDVSIRPGWFYHESENGQVKTVEQLMDLYFNSVGHNANLLLNFPVNLDGKIPAIDSANAVEWYQTLQRDFSDNLLKKANVINLLEKIISASRWCISDPPRRRKDHYKVNSAAAQPSLIFTSRRVKPQPSMAVSTSSIRSSIIPETMRKPPSFIYRRKCSFIAMSTSATIFAVIMSYLPSILSARAVSVRILPKWVS